jgi:4-amino-4-deoxy-L-arabinose transferase-like glycosyltransferase
MLEYFPKYFSNKAIITYFIAFVVVSFFWFQQSMSLLWMLWGIVEVILFFVLSNSLTKKWLTLSTKGFKNKVFCYSFFITLLYVIVTYFLYTYLRGEPFEYDPSDGIGYHNESLWFIESLRNGTLESYYNYFETKEFSDKGYQIYLNYLYCIIDGNLFLTRLLKCFYRAWMVVLVYKLASRTFGESIGRMAAIFCMLMPHFSFYAASHRKEMEMILLVVWCIDRIDILLRQKKIDFKNLLLSVILIGICFTFRTALGIAVVFAFGVALLFTSERIINKNRKWTLIIGGALFILSISGGVVVNQVKELYEAKIAGPRGKTMEWRATQGNQFAKYAGAAVFAPMIVAIPFPTMIDVDEQYNQQRLNGGYYIKNILAFFVMLTLLWIIKNKKWRNYVLIYGYTFSYLLIIAFSNFAHSERFHLPALPFLLILAAYGISLCGRKETKYFSMYCYAMCAIAIAWNMFKLAGRGLL